MSLVIFFGFASFIFLSGVILVGTTLYRWAQLKKMNQKLPSWSDQSHQSVFQAVQDKQSFQEASTLSNKDLKS